MGLKNRQLTLATAFCALAFCGADRVSAALIFGTNLIQNPGAELSTGSATNTNSGPQVVPNWTTTGNFSVVQYSTIPGSVPRTTDPGPPDRGANFFAGGSIPNEVAQSTIATGDQVQDVSNVAALIDAGMVPYVLSAYLGGYFDQRDNATFRVTFQTAGMASLGSVTLGPVTVADRGGVTGLFLRSTNGFIPVGTRLIDFNLVLQGIDGAQNDGYADNLSFIATEPRGPAAVPEPASVAMLAVGLSGMALVSKFRKRRR